MAALTVDAIVALYIKQRDQKAAIRQQADAAVELLDAKMLKLEAWIKEQADAQGVTSFKTPHGTAFLTNVDFASVGDWDAVVDFVKRNDAFDMFERRISKKAVKAWIDNTKEVPAGVNYGSRIDVNVRRPTAKGDIDEVA